MGKDYYGILGVSHDADEAALKKAYRKQAMKWHPDRNQDNLEESEEKFKEVAEAYDVLNDPDKRAVYDKYGEEGLKGAPPADAGNQSQEGGMPAGYGYQFQGDPNDIFAQFFKGKVHRSNSFGSHDPGFGGGSDFIFSDMFGGGMGGMGGFGGRQAPQGNKTVTVDVPVSLNQLYTGCIKKLKITRKVGQKQREPQKVIELEIKPGWKAGTKITFAGEGDELPDGRCQDLCFVIRDKRHEHFTRDGSDLVFHSKVQLVDALTGFQVDVPALDGNILRVNVRDVVSPGYTKVIAGRGMPSSKNPEHFGNLVLTFDVEWPRQLSDDQKEAVREAMQ